MRWIGCVAIRESTSRNQANGSTAFLLHVAMKLSNTAAVLPPQSLPKNAQLPAQGRCRGWPAPSRRYRSPDRRLPESASAPPTVRRPGRFR